MTSRNLVFNRQFHRFRGLAILSLGLLTSTALLAETQLYSFSAGESTLEVFVPRAGLMSLLGHDHTIQARQFSGTLEMDGRTNTVMRLQLTIPVGHLEVADAEVSGNTRQKIEKEMQGNAVLHQQQYPEIRFESDSVQILDVQSWRISGRLTIRDITMPITFTASVLQSDDSRLTASGIVSLQPESFGIEPVKAMAGAIRTASTIEIRFEIQAFRENGE